MNNVYFFLLIKSLLVIYVHNNNVDIHKFDLFMNENCQINDFRLRMSLNKLIRWFWWLMKMIIFSYFSFSFFWSKSTRSKLKKKIHMIFVAKIFISMSPLFRILSFINFSVLFFVFNLNIIHVFFAVNFSIFFCYVSWIIFDVAEIFHLGFSFFFYFSLKFWYLNLCLQDVGIWKE